MITIIVWFVCWFMFLMIYLRDPLVVWFKGMTFWDCGMLGLSVPIVWCPVCLLLGLGTRQTLACAFTGVLVGILVTWVLGILVIGSE